MTLPINPTLVWDYEIPNEEERSEAFTLWYLARVLSRGNADDLKAVGFEMIYLYLPKLNLPENIRQFWEWYFNLPEVKARYEPVDKFST